MATTHTQSTPRTAPPATAPMVSAYDFALAAAACAADTRCHNVVLMDLRGRSPVTEFFVIATGSSPRQMRTAIDEMSDLGKKMGFKAWQTNGYEGAKWILADFVNVVAHVFETDSRDFYDLEMLWGDCPRIDWRKELGLPEESAAVTTAEDERRDAARAQREEKWASHGVRDEADDLVEPEDDEDDQDSDDIDGDEEGDAPVVTEITDESTGGDSVQFIEVDPPTKRGNASSFPVEVEAEEEEEIRGARGLRKVSLDADAAETKAERDADEDVEAVSAEDLPADRIVTRPMGGISAAMSGESEIPGGDETEEEDASVARKPVKKSAPSTKVASKKTAAKNPAARKPTVKKVPAKKVAAKKTTPAVAKKKPVAKVVAKKPAAKSPAKKMAAKKAVDMKKVAPKKKSPAPKAAAKKPAAKKR